MDVYQFLPSLFSIYLVLISNILSRSFRSMFENFVSAPGREKLREHTKLIENIVLDWVERLGFFSAMLTSLVAVFPIFAKTQRYDLATATVVLLLILFYPLIFWVMSHDLGDFVATVHPRFHLTSEQLCRRIIIIINFLLLFLTILSSFLPTSTCSC